MAGDGSGEYCGTCHSSEIGCIDCATKELKAEADSSHELSMNLAGLLEESAVALRGPPPPLTRYSFHDVPARITALKRDFAALVMQRDELADKYKQAHDLLVSLGVW